MYEYVSVSVCEGICMCPHSCSPCDVRFVPSAMSLCRTLEAGGCVLLTASVLYCVVQHLCRFLSCSRDHGLFMPEFALCRAPGESGTTEHLCADQIKIFILNEMTPHIGNRVYRSNSVLVTPRVCLHSSFKVEFHDIKYYMK